MSDFVNSVCGPVLVLHVVGACVYLGWSMMRIRAAVRRGDMTRWRASVELDDAPIKALFWEISLVWDVITHYTLR